MKIKKNILNSIINDFIFNSTWVKDDISEKKKSLLRIKDDKRKILQYFFNLKDFIFINLFVKCIFWQIKLKYSKSRLI